jgi:hypothetical protein
VEEGDEGAVEREVERLLREMGWSEEELARRRAAQRAMEEERERRKAASPAPRPLDVSPEGMLLVANVTAIESPWNMTAKQLREHAAVRAILDAGGELHRDAILTLSARMLAPDGDWYPSLLAAIARTTAPLRLDDVEWLVVAAAHAEAHDRHTAEEVFVALARQFQWLRDRLDDDDRARLSAVLERASTFCHFKQNRDRIRAIAPPVGDPVELIDTTDDVGHRVQALLRASAESPGAIRSFAALMASFPPGGKPPKAWQATAGEVREALSDAPALATEVLGAALEADDSKIVRGASGSGYGWHQDKLFADENERWFRGAVAFAGLLGDPALLPGLRRLAAKTIEPTADPRSLKVANACVAAVAAIGTQAAVGELLLLERSTGHGTLQREIRKALDALAAAQSMSRPELLERAVERHGLDPDGTATVPLSAGSVVLAIDGMQVKLAFVDDGGKRRAAFPAAVREADADRLGELRERAKAIRRTIASERARIDALLAEPRTWPFADWAALYLDHPITGRLARMLVWCFDDVVGMPLDAETAADASGAAVAIPLGATVGLWHPISSRPAEIRAWRARLLATETVQPVKQAFRELYLLGPAEERTLVYSNRFAGHVIRQVQAKTLMKKRGWQPVTVAWWDDGIDHGVARRTFPAVGIRAEFHFEPILDIQHGESDLYPYCTTDQVRFHPADSAPDGAEALELPDVPPLVFSETMRDVDLFVAVTSIGADPEWLDRGVDRQLDDHWREVGFGELSTRAEVRRDVLAELLPTLPIADQLAVDEHFLTVRGSLQTYRIHLGSGHVLRSPDDRYLAVTAPRDRRAGAIFLPFDDDPTLSRILAVAFLLAADDSIDDPELAAAIREP